MQQRRWYTRHDDFTTKIWGWILVVLTLPSKKKTWGYSGYRVLQCTTTRLDKVQGELTGNVLTVHSSMKYAYTCSTFLISHHTNPARFLLQYYSIQNTGQLELEVPRTWKEGHFWELSTYAPGKSSEMYFFLTKTWCTYDLLHRRKSSGNGWMCDFLPQPENKEQTSHWTLDTVDNVNDAVLKIKECNARMLSLLKTYKYLGPNLVYTLRPAGHDPGVERINGQTDRQIINKVLDLLLVFFYLDRKSVV